MVKKVGLGPGLRELVPLARGCQDTHENTATRNLGITFFFTNLVPFHQILEMHNAQNNCCLDHFPEILGCAFATAQAHQATALLG